MGQNWDSVALFLLLRVAYAEKQIIEDIYSSKKIAFKWTSGKYIIVIV